MFCAFIKHKEDMGYRSSIRIVYVFRELEASWASNWPTEIVFTKQLYDLWKGARLNEAETTVYHKISIIRQFCKYMGGKNGADCYSKNGHAVTDLTRQS